MIMNKFQKRLSKLSTNHETAIVIGHGFGYLEQIIEIYNTVFVIGGQPPLLKSKNLIYRENFNKISQIPEVGAIFFDLSEVHRFEEVLLGWQGNRAIIVIEGNEPIDRTLSKFLYNSFYECTGLHGFFHIWELKK